MTFTWLATLKSPTITKSQLLWQSQNTLRDTFAPAHFFAHYLLGGKFKSWSHATKSGLQCIQNLFDKHFILYMKVYKQPNSEFKFLFYKKVQKLNLFMWSMWVSIWVSMTITKWWNISHWTHLCYIIDHLCDFNQNRSL